MPAPTSTQVAAGPYLIAAFETRKPGMSPAEFMDFYDNTHVPLIKKQMGASFPLSHSRYYVKRQPGEANTAPVVFFGEASDVTYDVIALMTFRDEAHLLHFQSKYADPEIGGPIHASGQKFQVDSTLKVIGVEAPHVTT